MNLVYLIIPTQASSHVADPPVVTYLWNISDVSVGLFQQPRRHLELSIGLDLGTAYSLEER